MRRRDFLARTLGGSSLLAVGGAVPEFLARSATAADQSPTARDKDTILVVVEMTGGNDGLNTVAPVADDLYHRFRPTLAHRKKEALDLDGHVALHPRMSELKKLFDDKQLAVVQGVGYPNPDRSHFESMDIWQLADPRRAEAAGWLARSIPNMRVNNAGVPGLFVGQDRLPVALQGADGGVVSLADRDGFKLRLSGNGEPRKKLIESLNAAAPGSPADLAAFVRKRQLQTYTSLKVIEEALADAPAPSPGSPVRRGGGEAGELATLNGKLDLIGRLIKKGLGTRIYYASIGGFDTHSDQAEMHADLMGELSGAIGGLFANLGPEAPRVALVTYSEFGRRVRENGSRGTDHGAASCLFVAGPKVNGGVVGKHPSLKDLDDGDLKYHTDFRRVYASLLDQWLGVPSLAVLGGSYDALPLIENAKPAVAPTPQTPPPQLPTPPPRRTPPCPACSASSRSCWSPRPPGRPTRRKNTCRPAPRCTSGGTGSPRTRPPTTARPSARS